MSRFKVVVSYDGTAYLGWQRQPHGLTIQEVVEDTIKKISNESVVIVGSGRTDAKVHALGQVFHFDSGFYLDAKGWKKALNAHLPEDITIVSIVAVKEDFHARFHAVKKGYEYRILLGEKDVFLRNYALRCYYKLDIEAMEKASKLFVGKKDFSSFCTNGFDTHPDQVREIYRIDFTYENQLLKITFEGKGFLRYMVRMIVGTLIELGRGKISEKDIERMLEERRKGACRYNAKAYGLYLVSVSYDQGWQL